MTKSKLAIITRTKNRTYLLERALQSVAAQTSHDYVHVVLNDGGDKKDLEGLLAKYPDRRRKVVHNKDSKGHTVALNQAIRAVDSTYIAILDDDDTWAPSRVETVVDFMDMHHSKGAVIVMDRIIEEIDPRTHAIKELSRNRWLEGVNSVSLYKQCLDNYLSNGSFNYTREIYEELGGYDESLHVAEDWDFGIRFLMRYDADFIDTEEPLAFYHHRPEQKGDQGNSVFDGKAEHLRNLNLLRNRYLREDLRTGKFGIGYIMNDLAYRLEQDQLHEAKGLENVVRLEGHINYASTQLAETMSDRIEKVVTEASTLHKLKRRLHG